MATVNKAVAPYYDDYDNTKQYTQLLALPGRVAQAREITQIQSTLKDIIKSLGDSILKDGNIIEGCQVIVNPTKTAVTVTAGKVYIAGLVLNLPESTVDIKGVGNEIIGVKLKETIVTEREDSKLRDPAQGYDNYNQPGCHRIKSEAIIVVNDSEAATLTSLIDGAVAVEQYAPNYDTMTQTLARRTYDESGSYVVEGLNVRVEDNKDDTNKFNIVVESGKAYVLGYELKIPSPRRIVMDRPLTISEVVASNYRYTTGINDYELSSAPYVESITSITGVMSKTVTQSISSNTDSVLFDESDISVLEVSQGSTKYTVGSNSATGDCYVKREGTRYYLQWNGTTKYPSGSYSVKYTYTHTFRKDIDYELVYNSSRDSHDLRWKTSSSDHPLADTQFVVTYNQYLARKDTVYIDQYGNISVIKGEPAEYGFEILPEAPVNTLPLAYIVSPPGGSTGNSSTLRINVSNVGLTRFTMNDIHALLKKVNTIQYDQAVLSLNNEAESYETANTKRGIFTDPIIDLSKIDLYYNLSNGSIVDVSKPSFDTFIDLDDNMVYLPVVSHTYDAIYDSTNSRGKKYDRLVTLDTSGEKVVLSQERATKSFLINPYSKYPQLPEITLTPAVDSWINEEVIEVPVSLSSSEVVSVSSRNTSSGWGNRAWTSESTSTSQIGTRVDVSTSYEVTSETPTTYMRKRDITVTGANFPDNLDNISCYFDNVRVPLTPIDGTAYGTLAGTVRSNGNGYVKAKFTIPDSILTGIRAVTLSSPIQRDGYVSEATDLYQSTGIDRSIQKTVTTLTTVLLQRVTTYTTNYWYEEEPVAPVNPDPVGQTFVLESMTILKGIDLYFENKPTDVNTPVSCEIREVSNGTITSVVYARKTLAANSVNVSSDSRVATRFDFDDPVLLEANKEYAFVVRSASTRYSLWVAELGGNDIVSGETVFNNPYLIGVMMSSSNNTSWTIHQTTDVKFNLVANTYEQSADIFFNNITSASQFNKIELSADAVIPNTTSISWFYSLDNGASYQSISTTGSKIFDRLNSSVKFKATLRRQTNSMITPILALDTVGTRLSSYDLSGYYITKNVTGLDTYTKVEIVLDTYLPSDADTSMEVYMSKDNGATLTQASLVSSKTRQLSFNWKEKTYTATVSSATQCKVFIKLTSTKHYMTPAFRRLRVIMS